LVDIMTVQYPLLSEKTVGLIEKENRIIFIVDKTAKKGDIKTAVEKMYGVKVMSINTMVSPKGVKKAYIKLAPEFKATDLAAKLKIL
jgi:large subunit ribosomal protein L23